jgi:hypothetical protein
MNPRASQNAGNFLATGEAISFLLGVSRSITATHRTKDGMGQEKQALV